MCQLTFLAEYVTSCGCNFGNLEQDELMLCHDESVKDGISEKGKVKNFMLVYSKSFPCEEEVEPDYVSFGKLPVSVIECQNPCSYLILHKIRDKSVLQVDLPS